MSTQIKYLNNGDITIDGKRLTAEETGELLRSILGGDRLERYVKEGGAVDADAAWARYVACRDGGDLLGAAEAFAAVASAVLAGFQVPAQAPAPTGQVPTTNQLPEALDAGAAVVVGFPLEAHNGRREPEELRQLGMTLAAQDRLLAAFLKSGELVRKSVGALAQTGVAWVNELLGAIEPAEGKNAALAGAAAPMHRYFDAPKLRGQDTRRTAERAASEASARTTEETLATARTEARAELKGRLDERFAELLSD